MPALALLLVLAAPEPGTEAGRLLQVAWNSQYEWREDGVENATLDFAWTWRERGGDGAETARAGRAQVVVVGDRVARRHYPGLEDPAVRARLDEHVDWVLARFVRKPFDEAFEGTDLLGPEEAAGGARRVAAGKRAFLLKGDRIVAEEVDLGGEGKPFLVRVDYTVADLRDGYTVTGEACSFTRNTARTAWKREMRLREGAGVPAPLSYGYTGERPDTREEIRFDFEPIVTNAENPVVLDPAARDALRAVWEKRYTLPDEVRLEGEFVRKVDGDLARAGWSNGVKGRFQVWGMDSIQVALDERWQGRWGGEILRTCTDHFTEFFGRLKATPFDVEFAGVGFRMEEAGKERVIHLVGYAKALAFRTDGERVTGHLDRVEGEEGWWDWKVKDGRQGWLLDRMTRKFEEKRVELRFRFAAKKGMQVPVEFEMLGLPRWGGRGGGGTAFGAVTYELKKVKVSLPDQ